MTATPGASSATAPGTTAPGTTPSTSTTTTAWQTLITENDLPFEEELLQNAYHVKTWLRYMEAKSAGQPQQSQSPEALYFLYERALKAVPGSFKIWKRYLDLRRHRLKVSASTAGVSAGAAATAASGTTTTTTSATTTTADAQRQEHRKRQVDALNHCYERALAFMHKVPRSSVEEPFLIHPRHRHRHPRIPLTIHNTSDNHKSHCLTN